MQGVPTSVAARVPGAIPLSKLTGFSTERGAVNWLLENTAAEERTSISFFDAILGNSDRNVGNFVMTPSLTGEGYHIVALDHTYLFEEARYNVISASLLTTKEYLAGEMGTIKMFALTSAQRVTLEKLVADEKRIRKVWGSRLYVDDVLKRARKALDAGVWSPW